MHHRTATPHSWPTKCYGCGHNHAADAMRTFGTNAAGEPVAYICADCEAAAREPQPAPVFVVTPQPVAAPAPKPQATPRAPTMLLTIPTARNWYPRHALAGVTK